MTAALGTSARQALIALMVRVTQASNPDLRKSYRMEIDKATREELTNAKLITWTKGPRNAIFHELTEAGWVRARQEFTMPPPDKVSGAWLLHYATLRHLARLMERSDYKLADVYAEIDSGPQEHVEESPKSGREGAGELTNRVKMAYLDLAAHSGDLVSLHLVRERLSDVRRADLDRVLREMDRHRDIHLDPDPRRNALPREALDGAITIGGEEKHLITLGDA
ncbi:hypothetical protein [Actinoplanes sp. RD1]|uniref:hypothetical protein n=1 Tax=Actinoplanes sp. RD1 TaxID=3064538 RepID=UPI0027407003|nr:hypothetical protein [Actinoplanes sp. RD1]